MMSLKLCPVKLHTLNAISFDPRECWRVTQCSSSQPLTPAVWPRLQHNYQSLKLHVRSGVGPSTRKEFWLGQLLVTEDDSVLFAKAFGEPVDGKIVG